MPEATLPPAPVVTNLQWKPNQIFPMLADPARRDLLFSIARTGGRPATHMMVAAHRRLDATVKHLTVLKTLGLLVVQPDPKDGRRQLYSLSPNVPLVKTETGTALDFGFCLVRL